MLMSQFSEFELLETKVATQDLLRIESIDWSHYISGNEQEWTKQQSRFLTAVQIEEIEQREKERIPPKSRESTQWS